MMKNALLTLFIFTLLIVSVIFFFSPKKQTSVNEVSVAATLFPIFDITKNITGDAISTELILQPGVSTHTFDPSPFTLRALQNTKVVYAVGHGADNWTDGLIESINAEKYVIDNDISIRASIEDEGDDPHYWLSIPNAILITETIRADLVSRFPEYTEIFNSNASIYTAKLQATDTSIKKTFSEIKNKNIITLHDAWYYFADAYDLNIVGTFEPSAGREPTPQYLIELTEAIEASGSKTLYSEPQLPTSSIKSFVSDNNLTIAELDPIGGTVGRESFIDLLLYNAKIISQNQ